MKPDCFARDWAEDRAEQMVGPGSAKHETVPGPRDGEKSRPTERTVHEAEAKRPTGQSMMKNPPASEEDNKLIGTIANLNPIESFFAITEQTQNLVSRNTHFVPDPNPRGQKCPTNIEKC
jgi:hypothetical protein